VLPRGADHRFLWSVGQGLRPAEFHEKQWQAEAKVFDRCCVSGLCIFNDLSWFFDPASAAQQPTPNPSTTRLGYGDAAQYYTPHSSSQPAKICPAARGADHRFLWSVGMGLRPVEFDEKQAGWQNG
jgi:hypothetical protein